MRIKHRKFFRDERRVSPRWPGQHQQAGYAHAPVTEYGFSGYGGAQPRHSFADDDRPS